MHTLHQAASAAVSQAQQSEQALRAEAENAVSAIQQQANERIAFLEREVAQGKGTADRLTDLLAEANQRWFQAEDMNRALAAQMQEMQRQLQSLKESQEAATLRSPETKGLEPPAAPSEGQTPHLSFPSMIFEPDSSLNATVLSPIAQTPKSSPPTPVPKASPCASAQGAAPGAPATTPPVPASSSEQNELGKQVEDLKFLVVGLMKDVHRLSNPAAAAVSAPAPAEGAAGGAPQQPAQQGKQPQARSLRPPLQQERCQHLLYPLNLASKRLKVTTLTPQTLRRHRHLVTPRHHRGLRAACVGAEHMTRRIAPSLP